MLSDAPMPETPPATPDLRPSRAPRGVFQRVLDAVIDTLLPQRCVVCERFGAALHPHCVATLPRAEGPRCERCWRPSRATWCEVCAEDGPDAPAFAGLRAPFRFEGDARRSILEAKFRGVTALLEPLAVEGAALVPDAWRLDVVVPVPLYRRRRRRRGFNQAQLAGQHVATALALPLAEPLRRTAEREPQAALGAERRARNLEGVFAVARPQEVAGRRLLVVDDVTTTGATLSVAARALRDAGADAVYGLALARED
jgi:competence protein ComFC